MERAEVGNGRLWLRFQTVNATLCRKTIVSQKCFRIRGIAKASMGHRALIDGNAGYLAN